jgi:hypothetical protein
MEKINMDRRKFIGTGLAAATSVIVGKTFAGGSEIDSPMVEKKQNENPFNARTYSAMPTRSLGKTGYKVGILSLGGQATLEMPGTEEESEKIINRAIDLGVNYIDTAVSYGRGQSHLNIGRGNENPDDLKSGFLPKLMTAPTTVPCVCWKKV